MGLFINNIGNEISIHVCISGKLVCCTALSVLPGNRIGNPDLALKCSLMSGQDFVSPVVVTLYWLQPPLLHKYVFILRCGRVKFYELLIEQRKLQNNNLNGTLAIRIAGAWRGKMSVCLSVSLFVFTAVK